MKSLFQSAAAALTRLNPRERLLVGTLVALLAASILYVFAIEPAVTGRIRDEQRVDALVRDLPAMESLARRIQQLESQVGTASKNAKPDADFSLFAFIDRTATASLTRQSIASMNPSRHPLRDGKEETIVELRVTDASLAELIGFLQRIEQADEPVYVKKLEFKRRYEDKTRFDATVITGALSKS
jgi:type II secretory pathway component PulM